MSQVLLSFFIENDMWFCHAQTLISYIIHQTSLRPLRGLHPPEGGETHGPRRGPSQAQRACLSGISSYPLFLPLFFQKSCCAGKKHASQVDSLILVCAWTCCVSNHSFKKSG